MRIALPAVLVALALPSSALAGGSITAGANLGITQTREDADLDPSGTLGLFGRLGFAKRLAGQLEVQRIKTDEFSDVDIRTGTALLVLDLRDAGKLVPIVLGGVGFDRAATEFSSTNGSHIEGGVGLEYRAAGGFTLGADFRIGSRFLEPQAVANDDLPPDVTFFAPSHLSGGEYRSLRVTLGVRF
ncbi:MAG TPA: outer membrane beta-barrel protein [Kofleriaceae bacterium]|nr:outer membrane beta-barrel protein [Kofleriaceae bacterium]